jgi:hypothetical protein
MQPSPAAVRQVTPPPPPAPRTPVAEQLTVRYAANATGSTAYTGFGHGDNDVVIFYGANDGADHDIDNPVSFGTPQNLPTCACQE